MNSQCAGTHAQCWDYAALCAAEAVRNNIPKKATRPKTSDRTCKLSAHSCSLLDFDAGLGGTSEEDVWGCCESSAD